MLVEKIISSAAMPLSPGDCVRRVMEALSLGILITGPGVLDPCEKDPHDALAGISKQQREDLTVSAQQFLRLIAFRQIFKVSGHETDLDRLSSQPTLGYFTRTATMDSRIKSLTNRFSHRYWIWKFYLHPNFPNDHGVSDASEGAPVLKALKLKVRAHNACAVTNSKCRASDRHFPSQFLL